MQRKPLPSVLVVEDDPDLTELLQNALSSAYLVRCVGDVPGALAFLDKTRPDLILLDCLLPGGGAADVTARARTLACAVVLMSGLPEALEAMAGSGYPGLQKPFRMAELMAVLEAACAPHQG